MLIDNPLVMALVVFVLAFIVKRAGWAKDGLPTMWLVMGVSLILGFVSALSGGELTAVPACSMAGEPTTTLACIEAILTALMGNVAIVFAGSQVIYHALKLGLGDKI